MSAPHTSVLLAEVVAALEPGPGKLIVEQLVAAKHQAVATIRASSASSAAAMTTKPGRLARKATS